MDQCGTIYRPDGGADAIDAQYPALRYPFPSAAQEREILIRFHAYSAGLSDWAYEVLRSAYDDLTAVVGNLIPAIDNINWSTGGYIGELPDGWRLGEFVIPVGRTRRWWPEDVPLGSFAGPAYLYNG